MTGGSKSLDRERERHDPGGQVTTRSSTSPTCCRRSRTWRRRPAKGTPSTAKLRRDARGQSGPSAGVYQLGDRKWVRDKRGTHRHRELLRPQTTRGKRCIPDSEAGDAAAARAR